MNIGRSGELLVDMGLKINGAMFAGSCVLLRTSLRAMGGSSPNPLGGGKLLQRAEQLKRGQWYLDCGLKRECCESVHCTCVIYTLTTSNLA